METATRSGASESRSPSGLWIPPEATLSTPPESKPSRQVLRRQMKQQVFEALRRYHFGPAKPGDRIPKQRRLKRMIAENSMKEAWAKGYRGVSGIELESTE